MKFVCTLSDGFKLFLDSFDAVGGFGHETGADAIGVLTLIDVHGVEHSLRLAWGLGHLLSREHGLLLLLRWTEE